MSGASESDYTSTEVAAIIGWRYVRNNKSTWLLSQVADEFGLHRETVKHVFDKLEPVIAMESRMTVTACGEDQWQPMRECVLSGQPIPANGKALSSQAGAFVIACYLARQRWAENSELANLVRWDTHRTAQVVFYKMRLLPIVRYSRRGPGAETLWVVMN